MRTEDGISAAEFADEAIVARVLGGETEAFATLVRRHNQRLFRAARAVARNDADAEDILQAAYLRAFERLDTFEGRASLGAWLTRITVNEAIDATRRARRRPDAPGKEATTMRQFEDATGDPAAAADAGDLRATLVAAMEQLPDPLRLVFVLREVQRLGVRETAASLGISQTNVKVRLHRARARMRAALERRFDAEMDGVYGFDGERCDRIVSAVMASIRGKSGAT